MKHVGKYILITLLLLLGLCCVGVLYIFFVPNSSIFNITYVSHNKLIDSKEFTVDAVQEIKINSNRFDVVVVESETSNASLKVYDNCFGFTLVKNKEVKIDAKAINQVLTFNIQEPTGAVLTNRSYIELRIPKGATNLNLSFENKKAETKIDSNINIKNLSYSTRSGNLWLDKCSISGDINLNLTKATCTLGSGLQLDENSVILSLTSGSFDAKTHSKSLGDVTIINNEYGKISLHKCKTLRCEIPVAGGIIEGNEVSSAIVVTTDTHISIQNITNGASIKLGSGNINITTLNGETNLVTTSGNIKVDSAISSVTATSTSGNITIHNANQKINTITDNGIILVHFLDNAETKELISTINANGKINADGIHKAEILISKNGRANLVFSDIIGKSEILGNSGDVSVKVNTESRYQLETFTSSGDVKVNLAQIANFNGYTDKDPEPIQVNGFVGDSNYLYVKTNSGNLTVLDSLFY